MASLAAIFGCAGTQLGEAERRFFSRVDPAGFILFARNVADPAQLRELTGALRQAVGRDAPVLVDQEGGRVQRLKPPHWRAAPPPGRFGDLAARDPASAALAVRLNARLIGAELSAVGIDTICSPSLDLRLPGAHQVIDDRAFSTDPAIVAALGASDFRPFRELADMPLGMTGHLLIRAVDAERPATISSRVIAEVIRGHIGFKGVLISDDLSMEALAGSVQTRAAAAIAAGCDIALHCNGRLEEMEAIAEALPALAPQTAARLAAARPPAPGQPADTAALLARLDQILAGVP